MSLKLAFLAFLRMGPKHGYELKADFEELFGGLWEVNAGQIYTTLSRMQRDGLVTNERVTQDDRPDKKVYVLTAAGEGEIEQWFKDLVHSGDTPRDELLIKVFVFYRLDPVAGQRMIRDQRNFYLSSLRELTKTKLGTADTVKGLILDRAILRLQADLEWLNNCETTLSGP